MKTAAESRYATYVRSRGLALKVLWPYLVCVLAVETVRRKAAVDEKVKRRLFMMVVRKQGGEGGVHFG